MTKKVTIGRRPPAGAPPAAGADAWVGAGAEKLAETPAADVKMKRLTIDIPESLHRTIKSQCAMRGTKIADEVRDLLVQKYETP